MAKLCYAIRKGRRPGIVYSWDACKESVDGFRGAEYKGFDSEIEALEYLNGKDFPTNKVSKPKEKIDIPKPNIGECNLYVDGSYKDGVAAFGIYLETCDKVYNYSGCVECTKYANLRNILGELLGMIIGVNLVDTKFSVVNIYYDYEGLYKWLTGEFQAKGELQSRYVRTLSPIVRNSKTVYNFKWVRGHSGVYGNQMADKLAKRGLVYGDKFDIDTILDKKLDLGGI